MIRQRLLLAAAAVASTTALACGVCIEDRVAATYDHAVVVQAAREHRVVVFAAVDGPGPAGTLAAKAQRAAGSVAGIDRASIRAAAEPAAAVSFALDPAAQSPEAALGALARQPAAKGLQLTLLRVVR